MEIKEINFINFRNLDDFNIKFESGFNLFHGKNGQGKTSILEAIYFTATGKSFRTSKVVELIKYNNDKCGTYIAFKDREGKKNLTVKFNDKKKDYNFNGKKVSHEEFFGKINVVIFIPEDIELITGSPSVRRKFFDEEISQAQNEYYINLKNYNKILKIRNQYLKEKKTKEEIFSIYENEFITLAGKIVLNRMEYMKNIGIILNLNYRKIFDDKKELGLSYISNIEYSRKDTLKEIEFKISEEIKKQTLLEKKYGYSLVGPQRDEFKFLLDGKDAKSYSSQGEKKSIVFSLKLSEIDMIFREKKENPIFIIDDISSYFDSNRKKNILEYLKKREIQLFISSTEEIEIQNKKFKIEKGKIQEEFI